MTSDQPEEEFSAAVKDVSRPLAAARLYKFLRHAFIFGQMALVPKTRAFDWALELEFESLAEAFGLAAQRGTFDLKTFGLRDLPYRMIEFATSPYDVADFDNQTETEVLCLRSGIRAKLTRDVALWVDQLTAAGIPECTFLLFLRGVDAGATVFFSGTPRIFHTVPSVYVDEFGDSHSAYAGGELLYLTRERLEAYGDVLLSGKWIEYKAKVSD